MLLLKPGDSLPQIQLPRSGRIMGQILIQCGFGGLFNWLRRGKIRLADGKKQAARFCFCQSGKPANATGLAAQLSGVHGFHHEDPLLLKKPAVFHGR